MLYVLVDLGDLIADESIEFMARRRSAKATPKRSKREGMARARGGKSKKSAPAPRTIKPAAKRMPGSGLSPYAKLILDPCEAKLTSAPLPGRTGGTAIRCPFRAVLTVPTATTNVASAPVSNNVPGNTIVASIFPHAQQPSTGAYPNAITVQGLTSEAANTQFNTSAGGYAASGNFAYITPQGLSNLYGISSEIRPIAACIRMGYIGPQGNNAGAFVAYEGQYAQLFGKQGSTANPAGETANSSGLVVPVSTLALDSWTTCNTTRTVEARVNIAAADAYWQTFRATGNAIPTGAYVKGTGQLGSTCLCDPDLSSAPVGAVAVSGAVPGTQYLLTGAIVYEWVPAVTIGMPPPERSLRDPKVLQTVVTQLTKYGRMLVGLVAESGASPPGLMLDVAMRAFSSMAIGSRRSNVLRLGAP